MKRGNQGRGARPEEFEGSANVVNSHLRCLGPLTHHAERWFCELDWMVDGIRD